MRHQLWLCVLLLLWSGGLFAGPREDAAKKRKEAERLFTQGDYSQALLAYDEAHALSADPSDWLGRAQVLIKLRRFTEANEAYEQFLALGKAGKKQREIEGAMEDLSIILQTKITCSSTPEGATVYLNSRVDDPLGKTPLESNLPPGTHRFIFEKEGFEPLSQVVTIEPKSTQRLNAELKPAPALLSLQASPSDAEITVNGEPRGKTPLELKLSDGSYEVVAAAPGYPRQRQTFEVKAQQRYSWSIDLTQPPPAVLSIQLTPSTAVATLNGEALAQGTKKELPPGLYTLKVTAEGYKPAEQEVKLESGQESTLRTTLEGNGALLLVSANRSSFALTLDGAPLTLDAEQKALLPGGHHQLTISAPGASTATAALTIAGGTTTAQVHFKNKPAKKTKLALTGGVGLLGATALLGAAGRTRLVAINQACDEQGFNERNCALTLQSFEKQRRNFFIAADLTLLGAVASGAYWWYKRRLEGPSAVQLSTKE